jgi:CubicO group peptidase (beta-lactamase class C family)
MSLQKKIVGLVCVAGLVIASTATSVPLASAGSVGGSGSASAQADAIRKIIRDVFAEQHMKAAIVSVNVDGKDILTEAFGDTLPDIPATTDMNFRNGAVAFAYLGNLLLQFVDEGKVSLDDTVDEWLPDLPEADKVTLLMLANQTAGYPDFEQDPAWIEAYYDDPYHIWTYEERLQYVLARPRPFAPGENWSYSHSNFMILGEVLSKIGNKPLATLLRNKVLKPLGLKNTIETETSQIPSPFLHSFSAERRNYFEVPPTTPFYEEETFWNTQWGTPIGANQVTKIDDMIKTAIAIGTGKLLSKKSYHAMTDPNLLGFGQSDPVCVPECFTQTEAYNFGIGVVRSGDWLKQNPVLTGFAAVEAYLPSKKIAIAVTNTFAQSYFEDDNPNLASNPSNVLFEEIAAELAPNDAPPSGT